MLTSRLGASILSIVGSKLGSNADDEGGSGSVSWATDGSIAVPNSAVQWSSLIAAKGLGITGPNSLWLCQEPSGNLSDTIGGLTLTAAGAPGYSGAVAGWARTGVVMTDGSPSQRFAAAGGLGPNPLTTSSLWVFYCSVGASVAAARVLMSAGGSTAALDCSAEVVNATGLARSRCVAATVDGTTSTFSTVQPWVLSYNRAAGTTKLYTSQDKVTGTYSTLVTDGLKGIGATFGNAPTCTYLYGFMFSGSAAELSDAQIKAMLQGLGWTVAWT